MIDIKNIVVFTIIVIIFCGAINNYHIKEIKVENDCNTNEMITISNENIDLNTWKLEIPKINLIADISEGTDVQTLNQYVGHFEETSKSEGNIGLAGHNRGYNVNYFENLKELEVGDEIYYTYNGQKIEYIVNSKNIIKDTDWELLENTKDNRLTLITCVENQPELRRCIQAIEKN